jgi:transmembrane sensor
MTGPGKDQARIDAETTDWVIRQSDGPLPPREELAFDRWLSDDPRHARTHAALARTWQEAATLKHLAALAPATSTPDRERAGARRLGGIARWALPAALAASAAFAWFAVRTADMPGPAAPSGAPAVAEIRTETLADGSVVTLGPKSEIAVRFSASERRVTLLSGEAFFEVTHNPTQPFFVEAGDTTVRVVGTKFDVNRAAGSVRVAVQEGVVEVREPGSQAAARQKSVHILKAGQRLETIEGDAEGAPAVAVALPSTRATTPGAWRQGWLVYENARLGDLVADVNRYYLPGVRLGPATADLHVTASFRTAEIASFLDTLGRALPVAIARDDDGGFQVTAKSDPARSGHVSGPPK